MVENNTVFFLKQYRKVDFSVVTNVENFAANNFRIEWICRWLVGNAFLISIFFIQIQCNSLILDNAYTGTRSYDLV